MQSNQKRERKAYSGKRKAVELLSYPSTSNRIVPYVQRCVWGLVPKSQIQIQSKRYNQVEQQQQLQ